MKTFRPILALAAGSLYLPNCSGITEDFNFEAFTNWRQKFFIDFASTSIVSAALVQIVLLFVTAGLILALGGLAYNLAKRRGIIAGGYITGTTLILATAFLYGYLRLDRALGELILSQSDINLNMVFAAMHWPKDALELVTQLDKVATAGWAVGLTITIPVVYALWQIPMWLGAIILLGWSLAEGSLRVVGYILGTLLGRGLLLLVYIIFVGSIGPYYPNWHSAPVDFAINAVYVGFVLSAGFICLIAIPVAGSRRWRAPSGVATADAHTLPGSQRERAGWVDNILAMPIPVAVDPSHSPDSPENAPGEDHTSHEGDSPTAGKDGEEETQDLPIPAPPTRPEGVPQEASTRLSDPSGSPTSDEEEESKEHLPGTEQRVESGQVSGSAITPDERPEDKDKLPRANGKALSEQEPAQDSTSRGDLPKRRPSVEDLLEHPRGKEELPLPERLPTEETEFHPPTSDTKRTGREKPVLESRDDDRPLPSIDEKD